LAKSDGIRLEQLEGMPDPELFGVDAMAALAVPSPDASA